MTNKEAIEALTSKEVCNSEIMLEALDVAIKALEQEPKTGHWIRVTDKTGHLVWECDNCGWQQRYNTNFCPDCGCRMVDPQESEEVSDRNMKMWEELFKADKVRRKE